MKKLCLIVTCALFISAPSYATEVKEVISPGGIKAWLVEEHSLPLISIKVSFRGSGYAYDAQGKEGRANFLTAMLTEGAGDLTSQKFNEELESRAIHLNSGCDADMISASAEGISDYNHDIFSYLGMAITKPRFDDDALERTRRQTLSLLIQENEQPGDLVQHRWNVKAFGEHPYSHVQLGTATSVNTLGKTDLESAREHYLTRGNMLIAVVGDITADQLGKELDNAFASLPKDYAPDSTLADVSVAPSDGKPEIIQFTIPQTMVTFGIQGIARKDPDYYAAYVMNQILGGGGALNSRLGTEIREKRGLAYGVDSYLNPREHGAIWAGMFATRNEKAGEALAVMQDTMKRFTTEGPTEKEMIDAKQYLTGSFVLNLDSNADIANFLINMQMNDLGRDYFDKRNALIQHVTREDAARVAKRLFGNGKLQIVMIGQPKLDADKAVK